LNSRFAALAKLPRVRDDEDEDDLVPEEFEVDDPEVESGFFSHDPPSLPPDGPDGKTMLNGGPRLLLCGHHEFWLKDGVCEGCAKKVKIGWRSESRALIMQLPILMRRLDAKAAAAGFNDPVLGLMIERVDQLARVSRVSTPSPKHVAMFAKELFGVEE
jgi:hypothetical protein